MEGRAHPRLSPLIGAVGLGLLPLGAEAATGIHQALGDWLRDGGVGDNRYRLEQTHLAAGARPQWLFHPASADALNAQLLKRGLYPEAWTLDWREDVGPVWVFGQRGKGPGLRLVVGRACQCPQLLRTGQGVRWRFFDYHPQPGRRSPVPARIVRQGPNGDRIVFHLRP